MSDPHDPDTLNQLRILLEHLEKSPACDPASAEFLKRFIRTRIRALEAMQGLKAGPPGPGQE